MNDISLYFPLTVVKKKNRIIALRSDRIVESNEKGQKHADEIGGYADTMVYAWKGVSCGGGVRRTRGVRRG